MMTMTATRVNVRVDRRIFNDVYIPYLFDDTRTQIFFGGSSSGKSVFLAQRTIMDVANGGRNYLCVRNVAKTIRHSVFNELLKAIDTLKLRDYFSVNRSDMIITCANGYQILFGGLDDVEKIKSITPRKGVITDIWVEEATETNENDISQLNKRLRGPSRVKKRLTLSFNPILQSHWIYKRYFTRWDDSKRKYRDRDLSILKTTYKDNRFLTDEDRYDLENEQDKYYYEVYTLGNWGVLGAVIFTNWRTEDLSGMRDQFTNRRYGLDFGFAQDPSAMPLTHYDRARKRIYVFGELYEYGLTNDVLAERIIELIGREPVVCDSAEPKSIQELRNHGVRALAAKKGPDSVRHGIDWLKQQEIIVDVSCQNMRNELQQYQWREDKDGNVLPIPVDKNNHLIDALRYGYEDIMVRRMARPVPKPRGF